MKLLVPEPPLQVLPSLAKEVGINEAVVLQQLHYWMQRAEPDSEGERWVYNTLADWLEQFPWLAEATLKRILKRLRDDGMVAVRQPGGQNRTNHYRLIYEAIPDEITVICSRDQSDPFSNNTETTQETTTRSSSTSKVETEHVEAVWSHYVAVMKPRRREPDAEQRRIIGAALKVAAVRECCEAIDKCAGSDWHMKRGQHSGRRGGRHNQLSKILKGRRGKETTRERIDFWLELEVEGGAEEDDLDPEQVRHEQGLD